jgi:hypothetical protein
VGDGEWPRVEAAVGIVGRDAADDVEPGLLEQVVGGSGVVDQSQEIAVEAMLVSADGIGKSGRVAAPQPRGVVGFGHVEVLIDGSFVTEKEFPADFDGCWDRAGVNRATLQRLDPTLLDFSNRRAAQKAKYRGELFLADVAANSAGTLFLNFFQYDRDGNKKGIVKLDLRSFT